MVLTFGSIIIWIKYRKKQLAGYSEEGTRIPASSLLQESPLCATPPVGLVVKSGEKEVMSMTILDDTEAANRQLSSMTKVPEKSVPRALRNLIEPLLRVAPATGTAIMAKSSKLMEVVINGEMLAASDGNGYRAIAKASKGFEHARLHEPSNLQNAANAAAIWQIASIAVAQKHLADISATLKRIESQVEGIQSTLEEARSAIIQSVIEYLYAAKVAIENGEFLESTRTELERFDIELNRVEQTLRAQIMRESEKELERDTIGCKGEYNSAVSKHSRLKSLAEELTLCNEVRLANWYLCSIHPSSNKMLTPRLVKIREGIQETSRICQHLTNSVEKDCAFVNGTFTTNNTIHERRSEIRYESRLSTKKLQSSIKQNYETILKIETIHADRLATSRFIIEAKDGVPAAIYLRH